MSIPYEDFKKVEMRVGKVVSAERVEGSDKLLKLSVDFGEDSPRQVVSGIGKYFSDLNDLVNHKYVFVTNLESREIFGLESQAMIIATGDEEIAFFSVPDNISVGSLVR